MSSPPGHERRTEESSPPGCSRQHKVQKRVGSAAHTLPAYLRLSSGDSLWEITTLGGSGDGRSWAFVSRRDPQPESSLCPWHFPWTSHLGLIISPCGYSTQLFPVSAAPSVFAARSGKANSLLKLPWGVNSPHLVSRSYSAMLLLTLMASIRSAPDNSTGRSFHGYT